MTNQTNRQDRRFGRRCVAGLYQLYPLLVHLNLFGGGYRSGVERALGRYVS